MINIVLGDYLFLQNLLEFLDMREEFSQDNLQVALAKFFLTKETYGKIPV